MKQTLSCRGMRTCIPPGRTHRPKKWLLVFSLLFSLFSQDLLAQAHRITGTVKDSNGQPLAGVTVSLKGSSNATSTDATGHFSMEVPGSRAILIFSYVGKQSQEVPVGAQTSLNIQLEDDSNQKLDEVVVVGYGTVKKVTLTGSVSSVKGKEIAESPATNLSNSLVGRLPGLVAVQGSGEPGYDGSTLRIRGINTIGDNSVLVVVDGVPGRSLERIDPNSVESVTILKDASAAIYGSQGANGVILVTTKRGRRGKPEISTNLSFGYNSPTRLPKMADAATYATMLNEIEYYKFYPNNLGSYVPKYTPEEIQKYRDGSDPWKYPNTDWFKATLKPRSAQNAYNMTVSGGSDALRYFVSLGARTQEGNYYHSATKYNQYDLRTNLDGKISQNISLSFDVAGRMEDRNYPTRGAGSIFRMVMRGKPNFPAYWPDGTPGPDIEYGDNPVVISTDATGYDKDKYYTLNTNLKLNISIPWVKGLSLSGNASIDKGFDFRKTWYTPWYLYTWDYTSYDANGKPVLVKGKRGYDDARLNQYARDQQTTSLYGLINYERTIASDHDIRVMLGAESRKGNAEYFNAFRRYFVSTAIDELYAGGAAEKDNNGSGWVNARQSFFGRINYAYQNKYLLELIGRYDGSYIFPKNSRFGFFPAASAGWRLSQEEFWKPIAHIVNDFKLKGSWGQTGNDRVAEWQYLASYAYGNIIGDPYLPFVTNGGIENATLYETGIPNANITWEVANQTDIGFEASFLDRKLSVEADYFHYKRSKLLHARNASIPLSSGLQLPDENIASVSNAGVDYSISYRDRAGDFSYSITFNGSHQRNKILFWDETPGRPAYQLTTGHPIPTDPNNADNDLYYQSIGIFHNEDEISKYPHLSGTMPGDIIFADVNGDGKIDDQDRVRNYHTNIPRFTGGLNLTLGYKGFDLSILFQGATGAVNYISTESGEIGNFLQSFADGRWSPDNTSANQPRAFNRGNEYWINRRNTYFLHKTDYLRLKTFQLGYSVPNRAIQRLGIQQMRVYISGFNLLTYSPDYKDFDPELSSGSGQGYPLNKVVSAGINLTF